MERPTWRVASAITAGRPESPLRARGSTRAAMETASWPKMLSTMITVASTTRPKSMAPTESRFADSPRATMIRMAKARAKGMVIATITALRRSPMNSHCTRKIRITPSTMLCSTVWVVSAIRPLRS